MGTQIWPAARPSVDVETRRLAEAVRALSADRERLLTRITALERNVDDVTGSIKRQPPAAPPPTVVIAPKPAAPVASPPASVAAPPPEPRREAAVPDTLAAAAEPSAPASAAAGTKVANLPPAATEEEASSAPKSEMGADVGGATNFNGVRVLWNSLKGSNASLFEELHPLVAVKEIPGRSAELRLIVGPLADPDTAARFCVTLSVNRRYCQPTTFEGQPLQITEAAPPPVRRATPPNPQAAPQERRPGPAVARQPPPRPF